MLASGSHVRTMVRLFASPLDGTNEPGSKCQVSSEPVRKKTPSTSETPIPSTWYGEFPTLYSGTTILIPEGSTDDIVASSRVHHDDLFDLYRLCKDEKERCSIAVSMPLFCKKPCSCFLTYSRKRESGRQHIMAILLDPGCVDYNPFRSRGYDDIEHSLP